MRNQQRGTEKVALLRADYVFCLSLFYVTGRVDCFGVCVPSRLYNKVLCVLCVLTLMHYTVCYFTGIFYTVVRHISMLFIDNKDSGFWMESGLC